MGEEDGCQDVVSERMLAFQTIGQFIDRDFAAQKGVGESDSLKYLSLIL